MKHYQLRVLNEKRELDDRLDKLKAFLGEGRFTQLDLAEQENLREQAIIMTAYSTVLGQRIRRFNLSSTNGGGLISGTA